MNVVTQPKFDLANFRIRVCSFADNKALMSGAKRCTYKCFALSVSE